METKLKETLEVVRLLEGADFHCNEEALFQDYQKQEANKSTLVIKILTFLGIFLASLTFLGFLALVHLFDSEVSVLMLGVCLLFLSVFLDKKYDELILNLFRISAYLIGGSLFIGGLFELRLEENTVIGLVIVIALALLMATHNYIIAFISVIVINGAMLAWIDKNALDAVNIYLSYNAFIMTFFFLNEARIITYNAKASELYDSIRIGLVISFVFGLIMSSSGYMPQSSIWLSSVIIILTLLYVVHIILKINKIELLRQQIFVYLLTATILVPTIYSPSISGAMLIILLSFLVNYKTSLVIGLGALVYFISLYYYDLSITLLAKSIILFSSGVLFIVFYLLINKKLNTNEKV